MKKLLLFIALALSLWASPASAQCNGNFAAGTVCGSNSGGAPGPITSFATLGTCNVLSQGAKGDGITDDTAAFQACVTKLTTGTGTTGGTLYVPPAPSGQYCLFSGLTISASLPITLTGSSFDNTSLNTCGHDVNLLTLSTASHSVRNIGLFGPNIAGTAHDALVVTANGVVIDHVKVFYGRYAINYSGADGRLSNVSATTTYGAAIVYTTGSFSCNPCTLDQQYPVSTPLPGTNRTVWASGTPYTSGAVVTSGTHVWQAANSGTSGGGSAPATQAYNTYIQDNVTGTCPSPSAGVCWLYVGETGNAAAQIDSGSSTVVFSNRSDFTGSYTYGVNITGTGQGVTLTNSTFSSYQTGVFDQSSVGGLLVFGSNCGGMISSTSQCFYFRSGDDQIIGSSMIAMPIGIEVDAGKNYVIANNQVFGAGTAAVYINGSVTNVSVTGNVVSSSVNWGTNAIGIDIVGAGTDYLTVLANECHGATTCLSNSSTGTHNVIETTPGIITLNSLTLTSPLTAPNGGSGIASPAAHSILQAEGSSNFGLLTAAVVGNIIVDQGSGSDWASVTLSQDCTLAGGGAITCTKTNNVAFGNLATANANTGLTKSGTNLNSNAEVIDYFAPGLVAAVTNTKGAFTVWKNASTVDNMAASATAFTCSGNPTVTVYECGTSPTCAAPTVIGGITITAAGTAVSALTLSSSTINAGDYTAWAISAGTCTSLDIHGKIQAHAN